MKILRSIDEVIEISLTHSVENEYYDCEIDINGHKAHEVSICNRDLLFFTDKGTLNYLVDSYGSRHSIELFNNEEIEYNEN